MYKGDWQATVQGLQRVRCDRTAHTHTHTHTHTHIHEKGLGRDEGVGWRWQGEGGTGLALWVPREAWFFPVIYLAHPVP